MEIFYTDQFRLPLPSGHRFPVAKYALLRKRVMEARLVREQDLRVPHDATDLELGRAHATPYLTRVISGDLSPREMRAIGFPWSPELVERSRRSNGATIELARQRLKRDWR